MALWTDGEAQAAPMSKAKTNLSLIEGQLPEGKRFFGGDDIGFLDIALSGITHWMEVFEEIAGVRLLTEEEHPALYRWAREYTANQTVRQCLPDKDRLLAALAPMRDTFVSMTKAMSAQK